MINGLDGVVAAETTLSDVDGERGHLVIRGFAIEDVAGRVAYESIVHLLLDGFVADLPEADGLARALANARVDVFARLAPMLPALAKLPVYDGVRAGVAMMPDSTELADALRLIAAPAVLTPALIRVGTGLDAIPPNTGARHAADILRMLGSADASDAATRALDAYLVTVSDHGLNASTFAARVVASTRAGLASSVLAGMSALKGPLHGGAPGPIIAMLDEIAESGDARAWLEREVARGARLMGFGHRIYRVRDPRADALKSALRRFTGSTTTTARLRFAEDVEHAALDVLRVAKPGRVLETNVEFYTALLLEAVGFPAAAFTCVFAISRTIGWIAHALEQRATGRLIRPQSRYIGERPVAA